MAHRSETDKPRPGEESYGLSWLLRRYRETAGLTQRELQDMLMGRGYPISEASVSMWENGQRLPSDPALFHHLGECLSLSEDQETALALAWVVERSFRYLEPYLALNRKAGEETEQLLASFFGSLLKRS